jgi:hypothetical protein
MSVASTVNYFVDKYNYQSYLEIGIHRGKTYKEIICDVKAGVEPGGKKRGGMHPTHAMTSDDFFFQNDDRFDIVFIDGLHHADQFMRDVINSLDCLNEGGTIFCHDINPVHKLWQLVPQPPDFYKGGKQMWRGDVWKGWVKLRATREDLWMYTIQGTRARPQSFHGHCLGVIRKGKQDLLPLSRKLIDPTYEDFNENRAEWLNLITWEDFEELL